MTVDCREKFPPRCGGLLAGVLLLIAIPSVAMGQTPPPSPPDLAYLEKLLHDPNLDRTRALSDPLGYGYDLFFYANWPALAKTRGRPDPKKQFGDIGEVLWETWKNSAETYRLCGLMPEAWEKPEPVPPDVRRRPQYPTDSGNSWQDMTANSQADGFNLKDLQGNDILYQIRMDRSTFEYILKQRLFNVDGQVHFAATNGNLKFDFDAIEVKTSWTWLDPKTVKQGCDVESYFTTNAYYPQLDDNGKPAGFRTGVMGLTGMHIITKAIPNWVWITFEQKNNENCIGSPRTIPISPDVVAENAKMQPLLKGKWANYMMVGVQIGMGTPQQPVTLANTQIEFHFQPRSSCMTCHAISSVATHLPVQTTDTLRMSYVDLAVNPPDPPYYIGPAPPLGVFKSMDFVWSLRHAYRLTTGSQNCK